MITNLNDIQLVEPITGKERQFNILKECLVDGTFLPKTVLYEDIDNSFKEWAKNKIKLISDEGAEFPTFTLYSNQRFSEYSQTWEYVDENKNLILNFKTITRENNPNGGTIHNKLWNIPGNSFFLMARKRVLDDNGTESYLNLKMKQPTAVDLKYKLTVFTTKFQKLNEFNTEINRIFNSRQEYINPNGHYMPLILENINDETQYNIDDRQYYAQTVEISLLAYLITEDDYKVEEIPLKRGLSIPMMRVKKKRADVEIEELCPNKDSNFYYEPVSLNIDFPICVDRSNFTIDIDFVSDTPIKIDNVRPNYKIYVNDEAYEDSILKFKDGDKIEIRIKRLNQTKQAKMTISGYNPNRVFDDNLDDMENSSDDINYEEIIDITTE